MPTQFKIFGPGPFKIFEIIGVIDHPAAVGVFVVDLDFQYFTVMGSNLFEFLMITVIISCLMHHKSLQKDAKW